MICDSSLLWRSDAPQRSSRDERSTFHSFTTFSSSPDSRSVSFANLSSDVQRPRLITAGGSSQAEQLIGRSSPPAPSSSSPSSSSSLVVGRALKGLRFFSATFFCIYFLLSSAAAAFVRINRCWRALGLIGGGTVMVAGLDRSLAGQECRWTGVSLDRSVAMTLAALKMHFL